MNLNNQLAKMRCIPSEHGLAVLSYLSGLIAYNVVGAYIDAKDILNKYREGKLEETGMCKFDVVNIKSEWHAVKYGANANSISRFFDSLIWPVSTATDIVPAVVLFLNPKK